MIIPDKSSSWAMRHCFIDFIKRCHFGRVSTPTTTRANNLVNMQNGWGGKTAFGESAASPFFTGCERILSNHAHTPAHTHCLEDKGKDTQDNWF